jgi:hypothetical protein
MPKRGGHVISWRLGPAPWIVAAAYIYTPCKPPARVDRIIRVTHGVCKHSRYSEVLLAGACGFYLSLLERVFHVKILCLRAVISFLFFVIAYRFYNRANASPSARE